MIIDIDSIYSFIFQHFEKTFKNFLTKKELELRTSYITENFTTLPPLSIFKTLLYCDTNNEVGKLAIDFRIKFINSDFETVISECSSFEIDNFESECKEELYRHIIQECSLINFAFLRKSINKDLNLEELYNEHNNVSLSLNRIDKCVCRAQLLDSKAYWLNSNEKCISAIYGINILDGSKLSNESIEIIENENRSRIELFSKLKDKYPNLHKSEFVKHCEFLG